MPIKSLSDVAEHNFRSLEEVERYVQDLEIKIRENVSLLNKYEVLFARTMETSATEFKINVNKQGKPMKKRKGAFIMQQKIKKVVVPDVSKLQKNFAVVDELFDALDKLNTVESIVSVHFRGKPGAGDMIKGIQTRRKLTEKKLEEAQQFLANVGKKYEPTEFKKFCEEVFDGIKEELDYDDTETFVYVTPDEGQKLRFTHYLRLIGLEDDSGQQFPQFYIAFTCTLAPVGKKQVDVDYYVTVLHDFQTPGKFDLGTEVDAAAGAIKVIGGILESENFVTTLGTLPLNLETDKLKKNQFSSKNKIVSIEADENSISFNLVKGVKETDLQKIIQDLFLDVRGLVGRTKADLRVRAVKVLGKYKVIFTLANLAQDGQVSVNDAKWLQEKYGIDDDKLRRIVRIINGG